MNSSNQSSFSAPQYGGLLLWVLLLVVATLAVFGQVYNHGFLSWDDEQHVVQNPNVNPPTWHGVGQSWRRPYWGLYIPLSYTFFAAQSWLAGQPPSPAVFHLGKLALHVSCVLLVFVILRRLLGHGGAACAGALLFGLHPVQVESVAWISETRGVLCGLFSLLAVWQYLCYADTPQSAKSAAVHYVLATVAFVLALLSKPVAVAVPLIVGVLELGLLRGSVRRLLLGAGPWLIAAAGWAVLTKLQQPDELLPQVPPLWARPLLAGDALAFYLYKLVAPLQLGPDYGHTPAWVMQQWWFCLAWLLPAALLVALGCLRNRGPWLTAAAVSLVWLLPVLGLIPFTFQRISTVADRYLYLALLGPALALSWSLSRRWNRLTLAITAPILCLLGLLSFLQTAHWRDNYTLFAHALRVNSRSVVGKQHRGLLLAKAGRHEEAMRWYREALSEHPGHQELYVNLAISLEARRRADEALEVLQKALERNPRWPHVHCKLADVLKAQGKTKQAEQHYRRALEIDPHFILPYVSLGWILWNRGAADDAIRLYRAGLRAEPNHAELHDNLGQALEASGRPDEAAWHYRASLRIRPHEPLARFNLGNVLLDQGKVDEAIDQFREALKLDPDHARAHVNLGVALLKQAKSREAIEHQREALRIEPDLVEAHFHLGRALEAEGRNKQAEAAFRDALALAPADSELAGRIQQILRAYEDR